MRASEFVRKKKPQQELDELSFLGSPCTKDCSGHRAGYAWSKARGNRSALSIATVSTMVQDWQRRANRINKQQIGLSEKRKNYEIK